MEKYNIFLVSDCTGDTLCSVSRSIVSRFPKLDTIEHIYPWTRTKEQIIQIVKKASDINAIIFYTIVDDEAQVFLKDTCQENNVKFVSVLSHAIVDFSKIINMEPLSYPVTKFNMDEEYFQRINAINFAISHDDGQMCDMLDDADIIIVGVSRTSKSPTSIYLAYRGYKAANIVFINKEQMDKINIDKNSFVVGLIIDPVSLSAIRKNRNFGRINMIKNYTDMDQIQQELVEARKYFIGKSWPIIDITNRSVEEVASNIISLHKELYHTRK